MQKHELIRNAKPHYSEVQILELEHAVDYAAKMHEGQMRKSGEPYIVHPLRVADILVDWGMDIDTVLAGVLHDTLEDTGATIDDIESLFGRDVAFLVDGVTKVSQARAGMRDISSYLPQTRDNLSKLLIAVGQDIRVIIIKLADRLHNLQTLQHMSKEKQRKIATESLQVFAPMADRMGMGRVRMQIEELSFSYLEPKEYNRLRKEIKDRLGKSHKRMATVQKEVEATLHKEGIVFKLDGRVKSVYSLHKKLKKTKGDIDDIFDLIALRIVVSNKEDCYRTLGILHSLYQPMVSRIKDYIAVPKPNGYRSLHTTVITPTKQIVEFQIRTQEMHDYAERGLAASFHYNEQKLTDHYTKGRAAALPAHLQWIVQLQELALKLKNDEEIPMDNLRLDLFSDRIFVYSPKGDIYNLPEGAYPLDFAFLIHSDIGKSAVGFKVNGKMVAFDRQLQNGDVVEVLTKRFSRPKKAWLDLVKTAHARDKLRSQLKKTV